jgi:predicted component of viral defense system (DUF524 family)
MPLLLQAAGSGWELEIIGKLPELPPFITTVPDSSIGVSGATLESLMAHDPKTGEMRSVAADVPLEPLFYEAVSYDIHFERTDPTASIVLPPGAEPRRVRADTEHHNINFGNNVGFADVIVSCATGQTKLRLEVFSRKADYRSDYLAMRGEVSGMLRNLAMAANAKTYGLAAPAKDRNPTLVEWFALLKSHFDEFIKLAGGISKNPHSGLIRKTVPADAERARRVSRQAIAQALRRDNGGAAIPPLALPRRIRESVSSPTYDTPENRYFKALVKATYRNLRALSKTAVSSDEDADRYSEAKFFDSIRPELKVMERRIESVLRMPFMAQVADTTLARPDSMVFHKHPLYSRFDKLCRLLNGGLSFAGDIVPIGIKETSLLYEYWCFLKIVALLRERFDLVEQSVVKFKRMRTTVALAKGKPSAIKFAHAASGKPLYVVYNRLFNRLPTIAQKPDNVIQFASEDKFYIFDAKYKIQFDRDYVALYGGPGPTTDDVNTMHRYRDAIAIPHPLRPNEYLQGVVSGAVVLFPYPNEDAYRGHKFYKSIAQVEIGGLPFLPNSTALMTEKIGTLLAIDYPEAEPLPVLP